MPYLVCDACGLTTQDRDMSTADGSCPRCGADGRRVVARFERSGVTAVRPMIELPPSRHAVRRARFRHIREQ